MTGLKKKGYFVHTALYTLNSQKSVAGRVAPPHPPNHLDSRRANSPPSQSCTPTRGNRSRSVDRSTTVAVTDPVQARANPVFRTILTVSSDRLLCGYAKLVTERFRVSSSRALLCSISSF